LRRSQAFCNGFDSPSYGGAGLVGVVEHVETVPPVRHVDDWSCPTGDWSPGAGTRIPGQSLVITDLPFALNAAFPWLRPTVGIGLNEGVGEIDVAAAFETYAGTSFATHAVPIATHPTVTTRHGLLLLTVTTDHHSFPSATASRSASPAVAADRGAPPPVVTDRGAPPPVVTDRGASSAVVTGVGFRAAGAPPVDRLIVPGAERPDAELAAWATTRGIDITLPHAARRPGEFAFDPY
jgi:hypothetical protein